MWLHCSAEGGHSDKDMEISTTVIQAADVSLEMWTRDGNFDHNAGTSQWKEIISYGKLYTKKCLSL